MAELNKKQQAVMDVIAGQEQPTASEAEGIAILSKAMDLPEELLEQQDEHLDMQHQLDEAMELVKDLKKSVKKKWSGIRHLARTWGQDMFHQAGGQGQGPPPLPTINDDVTVSAEYIGEGQSVMGRAMKKAAEMINSGALDGKKAKARKSMNPEGNENPAEKPDEDPRLVDSAGEPLKGLERAAQQGRIAYVEGKGASANPYVAKAFHEAWENGREDGMEQNSRGFEAFKANKRFAANPWNPEGFEAPLHQAWELGRNCAEELAADPEEKAVEGVRRRQDYRNEGGAAFDAGKTLLECPYTKDGGKQEAADAWAEGFKRRMADYQRKMEKPRAKARAAHGVQAAAGGA